VAQQLIFSSAPRGYHPGASGYCTVARSQEMRPGLIQVLEQASVYAHRGQTPHPEIYSYRMVALTGSTYRVLSRIREAGLDFTGRTNFIAHHLVYEPGEAVGANSPAEILLSWEGWKDRWEGEPATLPPIEVIQVDRLEPPAKNWEDLVGDSVKAASPYAFSGGCWWTSGQLSESQILVLMGESLRLCHDPQDLWLRSFTTYVGQILDPQQYSWKGWNGQDPRTEPGAGLKSELDLDQPAVLPAGPLELQEVARIGYKTNEQSLKTSADVQESKQRVPYERIKIGLKELPDDSLYMRRQQKQNIRTTPKEKFLEKKIYKKEKSFKIPITILVVFAIVSSIFVVLKFLEKRQQEKTQAKAAEAAQKAQEARVAEEKARETEEARRAAEATRKTEEARMAEEEVRKQEEARKAQKEAEEKPKNADLPPITLKVPNPTKSLIQKIAKEVTTKTNLNTLLDKDFKINADPNPAVDAKKIWYIDEDGKRWTKTKPEALPRPIEENGKLVFPSLNKNWLIGVSQKQEGDEPELVTVLLGRQENKIIALTNIIDDSMLNDLGKILNLLRDKVGQEILIQFGNDNKERLSESEILNDANVNQIKKIYLDKVNQNQEKEKNALIAEITNKTYFSDATKIKQYISETNRWQEDMKMRDEYEQKVNEFTNGFFGFTKEGQAPANRKLRTNNKSFKLGEFNDRQKLILKQNNENNDESTKTFHDYEKDATKNLNRLREAFFLRPIPNLLSEISKEDFKKIIIQTNEIASAKEASDQMLQWFKLETQNRSDTILEISILICLKQDKQPQTIVKIPLPSPLPSSSP